MTFSLIFPREDGSVALLKATAADGIVERWTTTTILGDSVALHSHEMWLAAVLVSREARRLQVSP
jgi:hypothetical protein